jgi:UPF0042 nucleotide-binding protein
VDLRILFLDATDSTLIRRFEAVRRPHPLQGDGTILDGIAAERARMNEMRENSDIVIDTSDYNIHQLASAVNELFADATTVGVRVTLQSFGFKYGTPTDADMIADARFLPNPFCPVPHTGRRELGFVDVFAVDHRRSAGGIRLFDKTVDAGNRVGKVFTDADIAITGFGVARFDTHNN